MIPDRSYASRSTASCATRLGVVIALTQAAVYGAVALFVASAQRWAGTSARGQRWTMRGVSASLVVGAVLTLAFAWRPAMAA